MKSILSIILLGLCLLTSCDDGRIPEKEYDFSEEGRVAKLSAHLTGAESWPKGYTLSLAGFGTSKYAVIARTLSPDANGDVNLSLAGIPENVTKLEVCILDIVRGRVTTFYEQDVTNTNDTIRINTGHLNVGMYATIQSQILNKQCANCHTGSDWSAQLNLTEGQSYADMFNVASKKIANKNRITPGDAANSVLYEILAQDISSDWKHNHSQIMTTDPTGLEMIKDWIDNGAKE